MPTLTLLSPAKVNLYLKIVNKRSDGYHNIRTLFERINLCDEICLQSKPGKKIEISCYHPQVPKGPRNTMYKAAKLMQRELTVEKGVFIRIRKRIPVAAGLGGGSSNAATVLMGLNRLWRMKLSRNKLLSMAKAIGSDVPFFMKNCSWALGSGRGDVVKKVKNRQKLWHILVTPKKKLTSGQIYKGVRLQLTKKNDNASILVRYIRSNRASELKNCLRNDLEPSILTQYPALDRLKKKLKSLETKGVMISGSGPSVFGLTESEEDAKSIQSLLLKRYSQVYVVRTL